MSTPATDAVSFKTPTTRCRFLLRPVFAPLTMSNFIFFSSSSYKINGSFSLLPADSESQFTRRASDHRRRLSPDSDQRCRLRLEMQTPPSSCSDELSKIDQRGGASDLTTSQMMEEDGIQVDEKEIELDEISKDADENIPKIGMAFDSEEELYEYYKKYAYSVGFGVRKASIKSEGEVKYYTLGCAKGGKYVSKSDKKRLSTKTGCMARINVIAKNYGRCTISGFSLEHNHALSPKKARFHRSHRKLDSYSKRKLDLNDSAGNNEQATRFNSLCSNFYEVAYMANSQAKYAYVKKVVDEMKERLNDALKWDDCGQVSKVDVVPDHELNSSKRILSPLKVDTKGCLPKKRKVSKAEVAMKKAIKKANNKTNKETNKKKKEEPCGIEEVIRDEPSRQLLSEIASQKVSLSSTTNRETNSPDFTPSYVNNLGSIDNQIMPTQYLEAPPGT